MLLVWSIGGGESNGKSNVGLTSIELIGLIVGRSGAAPLGRSNTDRIRCVTSFNELSTVASDPVNRLMSWSLRTIMSVKTFGLSKWVITAWAVKSSI